MIKKIFATSIVYAFVEGIQKGIFFLLTPFLTLYISPKEYGVIAIILVSVGIFKILLTLSIESTIMRYYLRIHKNLELSKQFLGTIISFVFIVSISFILITLLFGEKIYLFFNGDIDFFRYIVLALILSISQQVNYIYISILKATQKIHTYIYFYNTYFLLQTVLVVLFVINTNVDRGLWYIYAMIISNIFFSFVVLYNLRNYMYYRLNKKLLKIALSYSISIVPIQLMNIVNSSIDRYLLMIYLGSNIVGIYFIAFQLASIGQMIMLAINSAFIPLFFKLYEQNKTDLSKIYIIVDKIVFLIGIIEGILLFSYPLFYTFMDNSYNLSIKIVPILILSNILLSIYYLNTNILSISIALNKKKFIGVLLGVLSNFLFSFIFIERLGMLGVAIGTLIGFFVTTVYFIRVVKNYTRFKYPNFIYIMYYILIFLNIQFISDISLKILLFLMIILSFYIFLKKRIISEG